MKVVQVGLDTVTLAYLRESGVLIEDTGVIPDIEELASWIEVGEYDAVVIDLQASNFGTYVARHFRKKKLNLPVIGISAGTDRPWPEERAIFLENGGDDLIHGPANPRELCATLRAVSRRFSGAIQSVTEFVRGELRLKINLATRSVYLNGREPHLSGSEREMFMHFASAPGRVLSKEALSGNLYALRPDSAPDIKIIDVFVCKLRKKLAKAAQSEEAEKFIETVWGQGYRLVSDPEAVPKAA